MKCTEIECTEKPNCNKELYAETFASCFRMCIRVNPAVVEEHREKLAKRPNRLRLDPDALRWTPIISNQMLFDEESRTEWEVRTNKFIVICTKHKILYITILFSYTVLCFASYTLSPMHLFHNPFVERKYSGVFWFLVIDYF